MCSDAALVEITRPSDHYLLTYDNKRDKIHNMIIKEDRAVHISVVRNLFYNF